MTKMARQTFQCLEHKKKALRDTMKAYFLKSLRKEINRLLSKGMSNTYLKVTTEKN